MELKEKTGETAVISAGHGQTSLLTNNLFQVTNPFFPPPCLPMVIPPQTTLLRLCLAFCLS